MRYTLIKFRVHLLGERTFVLSTDHASLRIAMKSRHMSQRMARWLSFFSEYNFVMHCKPGKTDILVDALSCRPDYDHRTAPSRQEIDGDEDDGRCAMCASLNLTRVSPESCLFDKIFAAYASDPDYADIIAYLRAPSDVVLRIYCGPSAITSSDILWRRLAPIQHRTNRCSSDCYCQRYGLARSDHQ